MSRIIWLLSNSCKTQNIRGEVPECCCNYKYGDLAVEVKWLKINHTLDARSSIARVIRTRGNISSTRHIVFVFSWTCCSVIYRATIYLGSLNRRYPHFCALTLCIQNRHNKSIPLKTIPSLCTFSLTTAWVYLTNLKCKKGHVKDSLFTYLDFACSSTFHFLSTPEL